MEGSSRFCRRPFLPPRATYEGIKYKIVAKQK